MLSAVTADPTRTVLHILTFSVSRGGPLDAHRKWKKKRNCAELWNKLLKLDTCVSYDYFSQAEYTSVPLNFLLMYFKMPLKYMYNLYNPQMHS